MVELVAKRYGQAFFELAKESGDLDLREHEIRTMLDILTGNEEFFGILNHPKLSKSQKIQTVSDIFTDKVSKDFVGFLVLVIEKGRQDNIVDILNYTLEKIEEFNGFVTAHVTSAVELSEDDRKMISDKLQKQTGKKISLVCRVDKSQIGGLFIRINDRVVDNTVKGILRKMARDVYEARI